MPSGGGREMARHAGPGAAGSSDTDLRLKGRGSNLSSIWRCENFEKHVIDVREGLDVYSAVLCA